MEKQTKSNRQTQFLFVAVAIVVLLFVGSLTAAAQTTYKVGDRVEVKVSGEWVKAEVLKVESNGSVFVRINGSSSDVLTFPDYMRPIKANAQTDNGKNAGGQVQNKTEEETKTTEDAKETTKANKYGTRDPRTCENMKAPAKGAPSAALAAKYVICEIEKVSGPYLYLVENVKVEVGGGRPYNPNSDINVPEINVKFPIYSIRGSLTKYQCYEVNPNFTVSAPSKNCTRYEEPKAKGDCYKTTFGDWRCYMTDLSNKNENWFPGVAPPKP